jgi:hypothetical protein
MEKFLSKKPAVEEVASTGIKNVDKVVAKDCV